MAFDRQLIEARLALDLIPSAEMPQVAADALEAGIDGPATLRLAVLEKPTFFEVRDLLPRAMDEMHLAAISKGEAAKRIAKSVISTILTEGENPLDYVRTFERLYIDAGYPNEIRTLGTLDDELYLRYATEEENREFVLGRLKEFVA